MTRAGKDPRLGIRVAVRNRFDRVLGREQNDAEMRYDVFAPEYYTRGPDGAYVPADKPELMSPAEVKRQRARGTPQVYVNPWYGDGSAVEEAGDRALDSLNDAEAIDGYDSLTGQRYPELGKRRRVARVVVGAVGAHEELWRDWPNLRDVVDPRLPVAVVNHLPPEADRFDVVHKAMVNDLIAYHTPVAFDPENPLHIAERHGLVAGLPHSLFALRGAWRDYPLWARDLGPGGEYEHRVSQACQLKAAGCAGHTGGHFALVHHAHYLVVVPMCFSCRALVTDGIPPIPHKSE